MFGQFRALSSFLAPVLAVVKGIYNFEQNYLEKHKI